MIDEIQVENLALIREASLLPARGLTVITGETGAGKTALLSALKLLMGARASVDMVRDGEDALVVSGRFVADARAAGDAPASAEAQMRRGPDAPPDGGSFESCVETVVRRRVGADGRSRASIDGSMASARELAACVAPTVDLCGQFEHQQLMRPANHVDIFDAWAAGRDEPAHGAADGTCGVAQAKEAYGLAFVRVREAQSDLERIVQAAEATSAKLEDARFALRRIEEVSPQQGEYEDLKKTLELAEHAEALARSTEGAREALSGDMGALEGLNAAAAALEDVSRADGSLAALAQSLREAGYVLEDVSAQVRDYRDQLEFDPAELASHQERFSQLQGLLRSFGPRMEDVFDRWADAADLVSLADDGGQRKRAAERALAQAEEELAQAADELDRARGALAPQFADEATRVMACLEMGGAQLVCEQTRLPRESWTKSGPSTFEFLYRPGAGMQARPLARIASGGEVSRVMLACKAALGAHDDVDTLVFDEVDAGVGGAVAVALADVIADLAQTHQVIVATHLAQVAVRGDAHYVVTRQAGARDGATLPETHLAPVEGEQRVREVARMLSGDATEASLAHARELLGRD